MQGEEEVERDVEAVGRPERLEQVSAAEFDGKHVHDDNDDGQDDARQTCKTQQ